MALISWLALCLALGLTSPSTGNLMFTYMLTVDAFPLMVAGTPNIEHVFDSPLHFFLVKIRDMETGSLHFYKPFCQKISDFRPIDVPSVGENVVVKAVIHSSPSGRAGLTGDPSDPQILKSELVSEGTKKLCYTGSYQKLTRNCWTKFKVEWDCAGPLPTLWIDVSACGLT